MASRRAARVAERIREEASQIILYELVDPRIQFVTITKVDISGDLRHATIYFSVLGEAGTQRTAARGLESARGLIQSRLAGSLRLREAPLITFQFDPSVEKAIELSKLIDQVAAEFRDRDETDDAPTDDDADDEEQEDEQEHEQEEEREQEQEEEEL